MRATDFTVGWVCALPVELAAARVMLDEEYNSLPQPPPPLTDTNIYTFGRVGVHKVVAACLPAGQMGTNQAAIVASQMRNSFSALRFGLLVGIGGGVPSNDNDIRLGDVVISQPAGQHGGVIQFEFGKTGPDGRITRTGSLNAPPTILLNAVAMLRTNEILDKTTIAQHLAKFSGKLLFACPGSEKDTLYTTLSQHVAGPTCAKCSTDDIITREPREAQGPMLFFGNIASGNQVMKDGPTRERTSKDLGGILCFEMEAAGLMSNFPCLVVRGICDYADAHKNKQWQPYAAATAAACAKDILSIVPTGVLLESGKKSSKPQSHFIVPFGRNRDFVGRKAMLDQLLQSVPPDADNEDCQKTVIQGLGGVGKTQLALELANRIHIEYTDCSVFWVSAVSRSTFENGYRDIGNKLGLPGLNDDKVDVKSLVKSALEKSSGSWLLIIDNVDDIDLTLGDGDISLRRCLPFSRRGSILLTTRVHQLAFWLDVPNRSVLDVAEMSEFEATKMLQKSLRDGQMRDTASTKELLAFLAYLPLAIKQATAYIRKNGISTTKYLGYCRQSDKNKIRLLSQHFEDSSRYPEATNPIATTWLISFQHIAACFPLAASYLKLICFLAEKDILVSLLPNGADEIEKDEAVGVLKGYGFIMERDQEGSFDMHRLVRLATQNWLANGSAYPYTEMVQQLAQVYPWPSHENRSIWFRYMPHAEAILGNEIECKDQHAYGNLLFATATSHDILGKYEEAETMNRKTLELWEKVLGPEHPDTLSSR